VFTAGVRSGRFAREAVVKATEYDGVLNTIAASALNVWKSNTLLWRRRAEDAIRSSGLDYAVVRVTFLLNRPLGEIPFAIEVQISALTMEQIVYRTSEYAKKGKVCVMAGALSGSARREPIQSAGQIDEEPENSRARYLTHEEQTRLFAVLKDDLAFLEAPIAVSLGTGMRKVIELLKLKVGHLNFSSNPVFFPIRGGSAEMPPNWLIVVQGKGKKYRLIPMNSQVRDTLYNLCSHRASDEFVFDKNANDVNDYALRWGFEEACKRAKIAFGETVPGGIIWHDLRRTFATRLRANGVHEYDISDLLGHSRPGVTTVYARATRVVLEQAVEKLTEPWGQVIEFERRAG